MNVDLLNYLHPLFISKKILRWLQKNVSWDHDKKNEKIQESAVKTIERWR